MKKPCINDELLNFRIPLELAIRSRDIAREQGLSLSAFARQSMIRNVKIYIDHERDLIRRAI